MLHILPPRLLKDRFSISSLCRLYDSDNQSTADSTTAAGLSQFTQRFRIEGKQRQDLQLVRMDDGRRPCRDPLFPHRRRRLLLLLVVGHHGLPGLGVQLHIRIYLFVHLSVRAVLRELRTSNRLLLAQRTPRQFTGTSFLLVRGQLLWCRCAGSTTPDFLAKLDVVPDSFQVFA